MNLKIFKQSPTKKEYLDLLRDISSEFDIFVNGSGILGFVNEVEGDCQHFIVNSTERDWMGIIIPDSMELKGARITAKTLANTQITNGRMLVDAKALAKNISEFAQSQGWFVKIVQKF